MSVFVKINSFCKIFDVNGKILPCFKRKHHESMPWTCYFPNIIVTCIILLIRCNNQFRNYKPIFRRKQSSLICYIFLLKFRIGGFEIACWIRWARYQWKFLSCSGDPTTYSQFPSFPIQILFWQMNFWFIRAKDQFYLINFSELTSIY